MDDTLRGEHDNKTIGLLLCNGGDKVVAQYTLSGYDQPIGVSDYQLSKAIPDDLKSALPTVEEVEEELSKIVEQDSERWNIYIRQQLIKRRIKGFIFYSVVNY